MSISDLAAYTVTLSAIMLAPGPVVLVLIAKSASKDTLGAFGFGVGFALGAVIIMSFVCFGLSAWFSTNPELFEYSKFIMMAYILWLALGVWREGFTTEGKSVNKRSPILSSLGAGGLTCFISPYMMILFPLTVTNTVSSTAIGPSMFFILIVITFVAGVACSVLIILLASQISRAVRSPRSSMFLNRCLASLLAFGGGWMAFF